jgi:hypothetical protein
MWLGWCPNDQGDVNRQLQWGDKKFLSLVDFWMSKHKIQKMMEHYDLREYVHEVKLYKTMKMIGSSP